VAATERATSVVEGAAPAAASATIAAATPYPSATLKAFLTPDLLYDEHPLPELCSAKRSTEAVRHALVQQKFQQAVHTQ